MRSCLLLSAVVLCSSVAFPQTTIPDLLVTSRFTDEVLRYDGTTGAFVGVFASGGGLDNPVGLTFGPDGNLYVASGDNNLVLRYDGTSGASMGIFAQGGGLLGPRNLNFGPDGHLYVASGTRNQIVRFDGTTGVSMGAFVSSGNLRGPTSFTFGPDGDLYVVSVISSLVKRYDGTSGAFLGNFITTNINGPHDVAFGPDGRFYVTSANRTRVNVFDPSSGVFLGNYVIDPALSFPLGMQWDGAGHFYVVNQGADDVRRYDATTGQLESVIVTAGSGGLSGPLFMAFMPSGTGPIVEPAMPSVAGTMNYMRVSGFEPGRRLYLLAGAPSAGVPVLPCGLELSLFDPSILQVMSLDESGAGVLGGPVPAALAGVTLHVQALAPNSCEASAVQSVTF